MKNVISIEMVSLIGINSVHSLVIAATGGRAASIHFGGCIYIYVSLVCTVEKSCYRATRAGGDREDIRRATEKIEILCH